MVEVNTIISLRYQMTNSRVGRPIEAQHNQMVSIQKTDGTFTMCKWLGNTQEESLPSELEEVKIYATEYINRQTVFRVPHNQVMSAYLVNNDLPKKRGVCIITRQATKEELKNHESLCYPKFVRKEF